MSQPYSDLSVAQTILQQLGGQMFVRMTGVKHLLGEVILKVDFDSGPTDAPSLWHGDCGGSVI